MPTKSIRKRRDVTPVRPRKRKGDVLATDGLNSWPRIWKCLEDLSADRQGRGRRSGQVEPLLDRTAHGQLRQPRRSTPDPSLTLHHPSPALLLGRLPQPQPHATTHTTG